MSCAVIPSWAGVQFILFGLTCADIDACRLSYACLIYTSEHTGDKSQHATRFWFTPNCTWVMHCCRSCKSDAYLTVHWQRLGQVGGGGNRVGLLHQVDSGMHSEADKACHDKGLHNAVPALTPEPLVIPRHILAC